jgi:putative DNA primase/helicase
MQTNTRSLSDIIDKRNKRKQEQDSSSTTNPYEVVSSPILYPERRGEKVLDTFQNLAWLLSHFNAEIKYNLMTRRTEINIPGHFMFQDDLENSALARVDYLATINGMPTKKLPEHLDTLAYLNTYHPVVECIKSKKWDGIKRVDEFIETIQAANQQLARKIIRTFMIAAVAAAHSIDGFVNEGVLVLQGKQSLGKTTWIKNLSPLKRGAVKEGAFLDPSNKDSVMQLAEYWIVELGELDSIFSKSAIGRLKSFITMQTDQVRSPYARKSMRLPRRSVYAATVNEESYLVDETGNRRWWTINVLSVNNEHGLDMQQVWAEIYEEWRNNALTYLPKDLQDEVNQSNKQFEKIDPLKEKLLDWYDWESPFRKWLTASAILEEMGYMNPHPKEATRIGKLLVEINGKPPRPSNGRMLHEVPSKILYRNSGNV